MKKTSMVSALVLFVAAMMLSGCIFPYWDGYGDGYGERRGGEHWEGRHHDNGRR